MFLCCLSHLYWRPPPVCRRRHTRSRWRGRAPRGCQRPGATPGSGAARRQPGSGTMLGWVQEGEKQQGCQAVTIVIIYHWCLSYHFKNIIGMIIMMILVYCSLWCDVKIMMLVLVNNLFIERILGIWLTENMRWGEFSPQWSLPGCCLWPRRKSPSARHSELSSCWRGRGRPRPPRACPGPGAQRWERPARSWSGGGLHFSPCVQGGFRKFE